MTGTSAPGARPSLGEVALLFLKLGTISFGGPAVHIAMIEDEVVHKRRWLTHSEFLDYLGATNLIPGPNSTEMAIHVGQAVAGRAGLLVAGACFILPATCIVTAIAWAYMRFGALPAANAVLYGVKPVVIAVVIQALWRLLRTAVKSVTLAVVGAVALVMTAAGTNELLVLATGAVLVMLAGARPRDGWGAVPAMFPIATSVTRGSKGATPALMASSATVGGGVAAGFGLWPLFIVFLKVGAVLFGSGYVLLAFLRADLVERLGWLSERQLLDAVAVGQITPGPVFTTATFVGYVLSGARGAAVATVGIFLPAFVFVAASGPLVRRLRRSVLAAHALDGVNVASLALMTVVTWQLGRVAITDWTTVALTGVSATILFRYRVNSAWLVLGGAVAGLLGR